MEKASDEFVDAVYDFKKRRFKTVAIPAIIFITAIVVTFFIGMAFDLPTMMLLTFFLLAVSIVTIFHDHWILNSLVNPVPIIFFIIGINDVTNGSIAAIIHLSIASCSLVITFRKNSSLSVMLMATVFYGLWVYTISHWTIYYACLAWFCEPITMTISILVTGGLTSATITIRDYFSCVAKSPGNDTMKKACKLMIKATLSFS